MPPHETTTTRVTTNIYGETDAPLHVSVKNDSQAISKLLNSYDYTQYIERINLKGNYKNVNDDYGPVPMHDVVSNTNISVSPK